MTICAVVAAGCGPAGFADPPPVPSRTAEIEAVVYLIGDAGYAEPGDPVLRHIRDEILELPSGSEAVVVYLGDNIYWNGLHEPSHPNHDKEVGHLEAQIDLVRGTAARGIFVPGNHDWGYKGERGLLQIRRQGEYLAAVASENTKVTMLPAAGCPGPDAVPLAESVLLVPIDTDLWLGGHVPADDCRPATLDEALDSLGAVLSRNEAGDRRHVVAVAHHPLKTYGPHGGYFGLKDQFFPGTNLWDYLYIPLPFLYPIVRNSGVHKGDLSHPRYGRMQDQFAEVLTAFADQPLVWAAGHDHTLQVFHTAGVPRRRVRGRVHPGQRCRQPIGRRRKGRRAVRGGKTAARAGLHETGVPTGQECSVERDHGRDGFVSRRGRLPRRADVALLAPHHGKVAG